MRIYNLQPTGTGELVIFSVFVLRKSEIYNRIVLASRDKLWLIFYNSQTRIASYVTVWFVNDIIAQQSLAIVHNFCKNIINKIYINV